MTEEHQNLAGERAAMSGYQAQYSEFGIRTYSALLAQKLVEIRVADMEKNVGKLDDICVITSDAVDAYQVKWSNTGNTFKYVDFIAVLPGIVEGWRRLCKAYPDKQVTPHLLTNRECSKRDRGMTGSDGHSVGTFNDFDGKVLPLLKSGKMSLPEWGGVADSLKKAGGFKRGEWSRFWRSFVFTHSYIPETISVDDRKTRKRTADILDLMDVIQEEAAAKKGRIVLTQDYILKKLGWTTVYETTFNHYLTAPEEEFEPNKKAIELLDQALLGKSRGYILLQGTPGSGKSTVLTQWCMLLPNKSVRYYAFDFRNPSSRENNESDRGDRVTFLYDMVLLLQNAGFKGICDTLPHRERHFLKRCFYSQLKEASSYYASSGYPLIIVVDGLDHITREYTSCTDNLLEALPSVSELPEGVVFVLGSQHYDFDKLHFSIRALASRKESFVSMPPLTREEVESMVTKRMGVDTATPELVGKCLKKSQGHPLYLGYILNQLCSIGVSCIDVMAEYPSDIEEYYHGLLGDRIDPDLYDCLGLICRISGKVDLRLIDEMGLSASQKQKLHSLLHLFIRTGDSIAFFHNSFRQYLIQRTLEGELTEYSRDIRDKQYYERLYGFFRNSWEAGYYLYQAKKYDEFITQMTPEKLFVQMKDFRPLWSIKRDLRYGVEIARQRRDPYLLVRYMLFEAQLSQMGQNYSATSFVKDLLELGEVALAKKIVLSDNELHCDPGRALYLSTLFYDAGESDEAKELFDRAYPPFMYKRLDKREENRYKAGYELEAWTNDALSWVYAATRFHPHSYIQSHITRFVQQINLFSDFYDTKRYEGFDESAFMLDVKKELIDSLIEQKRWPELEEYIACTLSAKEQLVFRFEAYRDAYLAILDSGSEPDIAAHYYGLLTSTFDQFPDKGKPYLQMASLSFKAKKGIPIIMGYLNHVSWKQLGSFYLRSGDEFASFNTHICYIRLRAYMGQNDSLSSLAPDDFSREDNQLMVYYARRVFSLARFDGWAQAGEKKEKEFLSEVDAYFQSFDNLPHMGRNLFSYTISCHRKVFYEYMVDVAAMFGEATITDFANRFKTYCASRYCKANADSKRGVIMALFRYGYDRTVCAGMLREIEQEMMSDQDVDGQMSQSVEQGRAWMRLQDKESAWNCFRQMVESSFGVGFSKDFQPSLFAKWIGSSIKNNPMDYVSRIHWLTSRLKYLVSSTDGYRIAYEAANELLKQFLDYNLSSGIKLARWMLEEQWGSFQSVTKTLVYKLLERASSKNEYAQVLNLYARIYLFTLDDMFSDVDDHLLKRLFDRGIELGIRETGLTEQLRHALSTQCPSELSSSLLHSLETHFEPPKPRRDYFDIRPSEKYVDEATTFLREGKKDKAWNRAEKALTLSSDMGWSRSFDGGTRLNACMMLFKIDTVKARTLVFEKVADDISHGNTLGMIYALDEIVPLMTDTIDQERLFAERFAYMNRILRANTSNPADCPEVSDSNKNLMEVLAEWLVIVAKLPAISVSERAKMLLAQMVNEGHSEVVPVINKSGTSSVSLETGMFLRALKSPYLKVFKEIAIENATSDNYLHRIYAKRILHQLGEPVPKVENKQLPATYSLYFPSNEYFKEAKTSDKLKMFSEWEIAPSYRIAVASHITQYLSKESGFSARSIEMRAQELMRQKGIRPVSSKGNNHPFLEGIHLLCTFRRPGVQEALDAIMEVAAELVDGGAISDTLWEDIFFTYDFGDILITENEQPDTIQPIQTESNRTIPDNWAASAPTSPRLVSKIGRIGEQYAIAEYSSQEASSYDNPREVFKSQISLLDMKGVAEERPFFYDNSAFQSLLEDYFETGTSNPHIIICRGGYFGSASIRKHWIAINPACAVSLGWIPSTHGLFAWTDATGAPMVQSIYWQKGNPSFKSRLGYETGEGWLVLATPAAWSQLQTLGPLFLNMNILRNQAHPISSKQLSKTIKL